MKLITYFIISTCLVLCSVVYAQPQFPLLTGRVIDNANLLSAQSKNTLTVLLDQHEQKTSNQVVVVTLANLGGYDISDYGYQLGRHWQIGQQNKDNGALLIVAIAERKVRIEVGYGLEGALTDALSDQIIRNEVTPAFKQSDYERGITQGVHAMLNAIEGEYILEQPGERSDTSVIGKMIPFIFFGPMGGKILLSRFLGRKKKRDIKTKCIAALGIGSITGIIGGIVLTSVLFGLLVVVASSILSFLFLGNNRSGSGRRSNGGMSSGGFGRRSGGGFSGGGGGFGGGGASGGW